LVISHCPPVVGGPTARPRPFSATHRNPDGVGAIPVAAGSAVPDSLAVADKWYVWICFGSREKSFECLFKVDTEQPLLTDFYPASRRKWLPLNEFTEPLCAVIPVIPTVLATARKQT